MTEDRDTKSVDGGELLGHRTVSRRDFLRIAGVAGATVGAGAGLGGLLAACGEQATTTTAAAPQTTTTAGSASTTAPAATTTSVGAEVEMGREVRIGQCTPLTGHLATFGVADKWSIETTSKILGDGLVMADGKKHPVKVLMEDTQSDVMRCSQVAGDLIMNGKVDIIQAAGGPDTVNPAADQSEALECPGLFTNDPLAAFIFGRKRTFEDPGKWAFGVLFGIDQELVTEPMAFDKVPNNKKIGVLLSNDTNGQAWWGTFEKGLPALGYEVTFPGFYNPGTEDFTKEITEFKKAGCEILSGSQDPPDFANFFNQMVQQGHRPKLIQIGGKAFSNFSYPESIGPSAEGLMANWLFHRTYPFKDPITGMTVAEACADYEAKTGIQWNQMIGVHTKLQWAIDVLKRSNPDDKQSILDAVVATKLETFYGPVDFTEQPSPTGRRVCHNVYKQVTTQIQCVKGADALPEPNPARMFDCNVVGTQYLDGLVEDYQTKAMAYPA